MTLHAQLSLKLESAMAAVGQQCPYLERNGPDCLGHAHEDLAQASVVRGLHQKLFQGVTNLHRQPPTMSERPATQALMEAQPVIRVCSSVYIERGK